MNDDYDSGMSDDYDKWMNDDYDSWMNDVWIIIILFLSYYNDNEHYFCWKTI